MYILVLRGGFGFHTVDIVQRFGNDTLVLFLKGILAFPILWNFTACFSKLSVLLVYISVIPIREMTLACRAVGLFIILWNTGGVLGALLLCNPIALNWDRTLSGHCGDNRLYYMLLGGINVVVEAVILLLPAPFLYRPQMKAFKKAIVIGLFRLDVGRAYSLSVHHAIPQQHLPPLQHPLICTDSLCRTCAIPIYRQASLPHLYFEDMTYSGVLATIFTGIEPAVALFVACIPFLWPLITNKQGLSGEASPYSSNATRDKGPSRSRSQPFKELSDDSSEIHLQPLGSDSLNHARKVNLGGRADGWIEAGCNGSQRPGCRLGGPSCVGYT